MRHFDTIVIGVGAMGAATCYNLAKRGVSVLGIEQFDIPNANGSSHGESRIIRMAYYEHSDYVPLLKRAYELWNSLQASSEQVLWHKSGVLYMGGPKSEVIANSIKSAVTHHIPHEVLDRDGLARRYPQFVLPDDFTGLWEPSGGILLPEPIVAAFANLALKNGAVLHGQEKVTRWEAGKKVKVITNRESYTCRNLVFCGGPWTTRLVKGIGVDLEVTRQVTGWVWPKEPELFSMDRFPGWVIDNGKRGFHYGFPLLAGRPGLKIARHDRGAVVDPENWDRRISVADEKTFRPALQKFLPKADGLTLSLRSCLYTKSKDLHFIVDKHPIHKNVILACGFSGHGFKFASVVGEVLADLAVLGKTELPIGFLGLKRFASGIKFWK